MNYETLIRRFKEGERGETLISLTRESRRRNEENLLEECYQAFLKEISQDKNLLELVPCFLEKMTSIKVMQPLLEYAVESKNKDISKVCLDRLLKSTLIFKQNERKISGLYNFCTDGGITQDPLFLSKPVKMKLNWAPEIIYLAVKPTLEYCVHVFNTFCQDSKLLSESFVFLYEGQLEKAAKKAKEALTLAKMRQLSLLRHHMKSKPHPKWGEVHPSHMDPALFACRGFLVLLQEDPRTVLNSISLCERRLSSSVFPRKSSHLSLPERLLSYLLGFPEEIVELSYLK